MTASFRWALPLVLLASFSLTACDSGTDEPVVPPPPPSTTGTITGRFTLQAGAAGSVDNARVAIYVSENDFRNDNPLTTTAASSSGTYTFSNVNPGNYYIDVWKDLNNNRVIDAGDIYGAYTTNGTQASPFAVTAGQTTTIGGTVSIASNRGSARPMVAGPTAAYAVTG